MSVLVERIVELLSDLIINWIKEDEVLLSLSLSPSRRWRNWHNLFEWLIWWVTLNLYSMRPNSKLVQGYLKSMHPMERCIRWSNIKSYMLIVEGHLWA